MQTEPIERKFVRPGLISEHLKCPICLDVFAEATRLFCGYGFIRSSGIHFAKDAYEII